MKTFTDRNIHIDDTVLTTVQRLPSSMGDCILRCDKRGLKGEVIATEIVMFVPKVETVSQSDS